jgi:membrane protease YdiL (CAAX protease family)
MDLYKANGTFASCVGVLYSFAAMGLPFFLAKKAMAKPGEDHTVSYFAPKLNLKTVSIIAASVFGCLTAMIVTGYLASFFEGMGFTFSAGETPVVNNVYDIIAMFLGTALVPPLVEEFAMRNVVMQPLRKYGNLFAIVMSAVVFGIFHGTPTQIPFAALSGLFIGYAVIATNSIWSGVIIHAIVNSISCAYHTCLYFTDEDTADKAYEIGCIVLTAIGLIGLIIYLMKYRTELKEILSHKGLEEYSFKEKTVKFLVTPVMIIAIIVFIIQAITLISYNSGVFV